jgi:hypothetical protein
MPDKLKDVLTSRKFYAAVVALLFAFLGERAGLGAEQVTEAVVILVGFIIGQGLADSKPE